MTKKNTNKPKFTDLNGNRVNFVPHMFIPYLTDLGAASSSVRNAAVKSIVSMGEPAFDQVIMATKNDDPVVRRKTCDILGLMRNPDGVKPLIQLLKDNDPYVRRRAANALIKVNDETALRPLINALNDSQKKVVSRSAQALCEIGDIKALDALNITLNKMIGKQVSKNAEEYKSVDQAISTLRNKKQNHEKKKINDRMKYITALAHKGDYQKLIDILVDSDNESSKKAQYELIKIGGPTVEPLLRNLNTSNMNAFRKITFTLCLKYFGTSDKRKHIYKNFFKEEAIYPLTMALIKILLDSNINYSKKAQENLVKIGEPSVEQLSKNLNSHNETNSRKIALTIIKIGPESVYQLIKALIILLKDSKEYNKKDCIEIKNSYGYSSYLSGNLSTDIAQNETSMEKLIKINGPKIPNEYDCKEAMDELSKIGEPAVEPLIHELYTSDGIFRKRVAYTLAEIGSPKAEKPLIDTLIELLKDSDQEDNEYATKMLIKIGEPSVKPLIHELDTSDNDILWRVSFTLSMIGNPEANVPLIKSFLIFLKDPYEKYDIMAMDELVKIGKPAVDYLILNLNVEDWNVRRKVAFTLAEIGSPKATGPLVKTLIELLKNPNEEYNKKAQNELIKIGELAVEPLIQNLDNNKDVSFRVATTLTKINSPKAVETLIKYFIRLLKNSEDDLTENIQYELIKIGEPVVEPLSELLYDQNIFVSQSAEEILKSIGSKKSLEKIEEIREKREIDHNIESFETLDEVLHPLLVDKLSKIGEPAVPALIKALDNSNYYIQQGAAMTLGKIGDIRSVKPLIRLMDKLRLYLKDKLNLHKEEYKNKNLQVNEPSFESFNESLEISKDNDPIDQLLRNIVVALCQIGDSRAINPLIKLLKQPTTYDIKYNEAVAENIYLIGQAVVVPIIKALNDSNDGLSLGAAHALIFIGDPKTVDPLIKNMNNINRINREEYATTLGYIGDPKAVQPLIEALNDHDPILAENAAEALVRLDQSAISPLITIIKNSKGNQYHHKILTEIGEPAFESLCELLNISEWNIRNEVLNDIVKIDPSKSFWYLISALNDANKIIKMNAAEILGNLGDPRAIKPLIGILEDTDGKVRNSAAKALNQIGKNDQILNNNDETEAKVSINKNNYLNSRKVSFRDIHQMEKERNIKGLIDALFSEDQSISWLANRKILKIGEPAVESLVEVRNNTQNHFVIENIDLILRQITDFENIDRITQEGGKVTTYDILTMGEERDFKGLIKLIDTSEDSSEFDKMSSAWASVEIKKIGEPSVKPLMDYIIQHKNENSGPLFALTQIAEDNDGIFIDLLDDYDKNIVKISQWVLRYLYRDHPDRLEDILNSKIKREDEIDLTEHDYYTNNVTLDTNQLDYLISKRENLETRNRRLTKKLIDENDEYMDDIIAGLYRH